MFVGEVAISHKLVYLLQIVISIANQKHVRRMLIHFLGARKVSKVPVALYFFCNQLIIVDSLCIVHGM